MISRAEYIKSVNSISDCPGTGFHEFAFIGRSNVGKSTLINLLTGNKSLARTSVKPGKTQSINYFLINEGWYMVDLPGYGWAGVSKQKKIEWSIFVREYLLKRKELTCLFVLIDGRLEPQAIDIEFINWCGQNKIPISIIFTKADKIKINILNSNIRLFKYAISTYWESLPQLFISSSVDFRGREEILNYIESIIENIG